MLRKADYQCNKNTYSTVLFNNKIMNTSLHPDFLDCGNLIVQYSSQSSSSVAELYVSRYLKHFKFIHN